MKNKLFMIVATMMVAVGLLLSVAAQQPGGGGASQTRLDTPNTGAILNPKPGPTPSNKVNLTCLQGSGDVMANVNVRNNTALTIPQGKVIYYGAGGSSGSHTLAAALAPGQYKKVGEAAYPFTCSAWYYKN